ncbi:MAG: class I SAM-dependent DNA methyltransferase [Acidimicrobiales bacterium]
MTGDEVSPDLEAAYAVESPDDNRRLYAAWADTYESQFIADSRYVYHHHVAAIFADGLTELGGPVLDVGCGTGIVGEQLRTLGVDIVDGIDISPEMLAMAGGKVDDRGPVYRDLIEADLTAPIELAGGRYAGIVSAGTFTHGHLGPDSLAGILRLGRTGARVAIGINAAHFEEHGFGRALDGFVGDGTIGPYRVIDAIIYGGADEGDPDQMARVAVFDLA